MDEPSSAGAGSPGRVSFLAGVFSISFAVLVFQVVQTRILSVIAWYYLAFFAISVAMLGMTVGAVWVYLREDRAVSGGLGAALSDAALGAALSMPASLAVQFSLVTTLTLAVPTLVSWSLLLVAMAAPYVFAGVAVSLALTRSPFPVSQVYGVDLVGAALGCATVVFLLNVLDAPSVILLAGAVAGLSALCFSHSASQAARPNPGAHGWLPRPAAVTVGLILLTAANVVSPVRMRPILVKDVVERPRSFLLERWNSYSRVVATQPREVFPNLWGPSRELPASTRVEQIGLFIDGAAGTFMFHFDGSRESIEFLRYDLVNLAYNLPGIRSAAIIGVGGGRDLLSAHLYGVEDITGVELNPIFVALHTRVPFFEHFSLVGALPHVRLVVDDARSWFASSQKRFDLIQMSMIDTWAATGAGAFSLSENGLYTLEGWRTFIGRLTDHGVFTVSRWYSPDDVNESGRMIGLATAALLDAGVADARPYLFVASAERIATLVLSRSPFSPEQVRILRDEARRLGFEVLLAPDQRPRSELFAAMVASRDVASLNTVAASTDLDLSAPTDERPFFFNQLRFSKIPRMLVHGGVTAGVIQGNLFASAVLVLILCISLAAIVFTILIPLRGVTRERSRPLIAAGSAYFSLIGIGFMLAEIGVLQYFGVYLGHPIYSLGVCLFSLILSSGLGSLASGRLMTRGRRAMLVWGVLVTGYLLGLQEFAASAFHATAARELPIRVAVSLGMIMPLGFLLGFAFPTGMRLVEAIDEGPTPWFWGINGATGVLASVLAVMLSMSFGIRVTLLTSAACYACLIPVGLSLSRMGSAAGPDSSRTAGSS